MLTNRHHLFSFKALATISATFATVVTFSACSQQGSGLSLNQQDFALTVGSCFDDKGKLGAQLVTKAAQTSCLQAHDNEVYFSFTATGDSYPKNQQHLVKTCGVEFEKFVGMSYKKSKYDYDLIIPNKKAWQDGDKEVLCVLYHGKHKKITGSVKNSAQ